MFKKLYHTHCKDTASKNESAKLIIVTRMLTILMICYTTLVMFSLLSYTNGLLFVGLWLLLFIGVLPLSYRLKTFTTFCFLNILILIWIAATILCFGWNIGTQQFLLALVVFCFFAKYGHEALKILYVVLLLLVRIALYLYSARHAPILSVEPVMGHTLQILNTLAIYVSISVIMVIFSRDSQALEGKLIEYNEQLMKQANTDPLTGLSNRRCTTAYLEKLLDRPSTSISICLCDIDWFKKVNDTYGHEMGDEVLKKISETFQNSLPSDCFISRWGGEEFLLIFPSHNGDESRIHLSTLSQDIRDLTFRSGDIDFHVTMTFGLVEYDYVSSLDTLLQEADSKLYYGKEHGRDQVVF